VTIVRTSGPNENVVGELSLTTLLATANASCDAKLRDVGVVLTCVTERAYTHHLNFYRVAAGGPDEQPDR
jgi:hypothetical protein